MNEYDIRIVIEFGWSEENAIDATEQALETIPEKLQLLISSIEVREK